MADKYLEDTYYLVQPHRNGNRRGRRRLRHRELENLYTYTRNHFPQCCNTRIHTHRFTCTPIHRWIRPCTGHVLLSPRRISTELSAVSGPSTLICSPDKLYRWSTRFKLCTFLSVRETDVKSFVFRDRKECVRRLGEERNKNNGELLSNLAES